MTQIAQQYLQQLLVSQDLSSGELNVLRDLRLQVEDALSKLEGSPRFYYAGSYGKNTMIRERYDLDIVAYWPTSTSYTIKGIFDGTGTQLKKLWSSAHPKTVCWETNFRGGFHIDVVPGRALDTNFKEANLHRTDTATTLKTSLKVHIDTVRGSGRRQAIRLLKLWRERNKVPFKKSFLLEMMTISGCKGTSFEELPEQVLAALRFICDKIETINVIDPANTNNSLSDDLSPSDRYLIKQAAQTALDASNWNSMFGE